MTINMWWRSARCSDPWPHPKHGWVPQGGCIDIWILHCDGIPEPSPEHLLSDNVLELCFRGVQEMAPNRPLERWQCPYYAPCNSPHPDKWKSDVLRCSEPAWDGHLVCTMDIAYRLICWVNPYLAADRELVPA
jgi:hypothetical protein